MSQYAEAYANPNGPGDARPTAFQIVKDNDMEGKLKGKVAVITGVSAGLGIETAKAMAATGIRLYLTARDLGKARTALGDNFKPDQMELVHMDQSSFDNVRQAAKTILAKTDKVNILIANAGVMAIQNMEMTPDGHEKQWQTNHLSHFLFFELLKPAMLAAASPEFSSRVTMLSASGHRIQGINDSDNYNWEKGGYQPWPAYAQTKTANIYMANEIERRYGNKNLHASSLHPGIIMTAIGQHLAEENVQQLTGNPVVVQISQNPEQGGATTVWATIAKEWEGKGGKYLINCAETPEGPSDGDMLSLAYTGHTYSPKDEARLWKDSLALVGLKDDM
jgi:NAD(P)-dependent dehydrogenase (short-subunit alcohol dehydrogenase family)